MSFDIPSEQIRAPGIVYQDIAQIPDSLKELALSGKAKSFERIGQFSRLRKLWVSGIGNKHMQTLTRLSRLSSLVLFDMRAESLEFIAGLTSLKSLAVCQSPKLVSLAGIEGLHRLQSLILFDCSNLSSLAPVASVSALQTLSIEGSLRKPLRVPTLAPLSDLTNIKNLRIAAVRVEDNSLHPLHNLTKLRSIFISRTFPETEVQALASSLPQINQDLL